MVFIDFLDWDLFYYEMHIPLPCSTMAFAFGWFQKGKTIIASTAPKGKEVEVTCYASACLILSFTEEFLEPAVRYLTAATEILGDYPFSRIDLILLPRCFACMGLARLVFVSDCRCKNEL